MGRSRPGPLGWPAWLSVAAVCLALLGWAGTGSAQTTGDETGTGTASDTTQTLVAPPFADGQTATIPVSISPNAPDYETWAGFVIRVDRVLQIDSADDATLERLRREVIDYREKFEEAEAINRAPADRTSRQIAALGPAPAEGASEPHEVASRRTELTNQLALLDAPMIRASEALVQASAVITEIDGVQRDRAARLILARTHSPFNPLNWVSPLADVKDVAMGMWNEAARKLSDPDAKAKLFDRLPAAILSFLVGALLVFRSRRWAEMLDPGVEKLRSIAATRFLRLLSIVLQLALPWLGLALMLGGLELTDLLGETGTAVLLGLGVLGLCMITGLWLVRQIFPTSDLSANPFGFKPRRASFGRWIATILVSSMSLTQGLEVMNDRAGFSEHTVNFLNFPVTVVSSYALFLLARIFRKSNSFPLAGSERTSFSNKVVAVMATVGAVVSLFAPLAGAFGYLALGEQLVFAAGSSFLLFGLLFIAQEALSQTYELIYPRDPTEEPGLVPTLIGTCLAVGSLPILALLWGARLSDLSEAWQSFLDGLTMGGVVISPGVFISFLVVFAIGLGLTRLVQSSLRNTILPKTKLDLGARTALNSGIGYIGIFLAAIIAISTAGIDLSSLAIVASALAVGIGFGMQTIVSNFVSGIILLIERPVSEGDWIEVGGQMGYVRAISVRATRIETFDRTDVIVPNSDLVTGLVTNWTRGNLIGRAIVAVSVSLDSDTRKVERILTEIAADQPLVVLSPAPTILFRGFGENAMNFELRVILRDVNFLLNVESDINHEIVKRFRQEGIVIPIAQRDVWLHRPDEAGRDGGRNSPHLTQEPRPSTTRNPARPDAHGGDGDADY